MSNSNQGGPAGQGSDSEVLRVLRDARACLSPPGAWRKGNGSNIWPDFPAGCFCADTAIHHVTGSDRLDKAAQAFVRQAAGFPVGTIGAFYEWHDAPDRTQGEIVALFDRAIALAEGNAPLAAPSAIPSPAPPETP